MNILEEYDIDPYKFLNIDELSDKDTIKKAYRKKAKILHPDKTDGKTDVDFKILYLSYKYALNNCLNNPVSNFDVMKDADRNEEIAHERSFYSTDFENKSIRNDIFADDDINFIQFEKHMKKVQNLPTSYVAENFYKKEIINKMKKNGKFDKDRFNAYFLKLKKENKISSELVKVEEVKAFNDDDKYMKVNIYDNMIINVDKNKRNGNYINFMEKKELSQRDIDNVLQTSLSDITKLVKEHKKDTGAMTRVKLKNLQTKRPNRIELNTKKTFSQMKIDIERGYIENVKKECEQQKKIVQKHRNTYNNRITYI
jgi:hypothetical protein